jgi:hypothetical protein
MPIDGCQDEGLEGTRKGKERKEKGGSQHKEKEEKARKKKLEEEISVRENGALNQYKKYDDRIEELKDQISDYQERTTKSEGTTVLRKLKSAPRPPMRRPKS